MRSARFVLIVMVSLVWLSMTTTASAAPFDISCGGATAIDTNPATVVACNIAITGTITDLNIYLDINENPGIPYVSDIRVDLVHVVSGTSVNVYLGPQGFLAQGFMDATFDDSAPGAPPTGGGNIVGNFRPEEALSLFNGLELSGDWQLVILDDFFPDENLELVEWRLSGTQVPEPSSALLLSFGLFGLAILSGRKPGNRPPQNTSAA